MSVVLVTGANGFIGRMLCSHLLNMGHSVRAVVRSIDAPLAGIDYVVADLESDVPLPPGTLQVDCIYHLAGRAHILSQPTHGALEKFRKANCEATVRLATRAQIDGAKRFVFVSSIGVNGALSKSIPFGERSLPAPHADYAVSKWEAEQALRRLVSNGVMELVVVRPPLVYAANAPGNFARLLRLVSKGLPLPFGKVRNRRSIVSLRNLVHFLRLCGEHPRAPGHVFFPSDGEDVSTAEIVTYLSEGMQKRVVLFSVPSFLVRWAADLLKRRSLYTQLYGSLRIDHDEARELLGWTVCETTSEALRQAGRDYMSR
ncbi:NAD-dependent epimerase/dehydratase family protein [Pseudomonas alkylphenolica]|uniref:NAD-dependent epimerase/dehydratase family protein n=1 Tax=Pseudomonas alkylphenolica TaxID=237609 RepID=UPI00339615C8